MISTRFQVPDNCSEVSIAWKDLDDNNSYTRILGNVRPDEDGYAVYYNAVGMFPHEADEQIDQKGYTGLYGYCESTPHREQLWVDVFSWQ